MQCNEPKFEGNYSSKLFLNRSKNSVPHMAKYEYMAIRIASLEPYTSMRSSHTRSSTNLQNLISVFGIYTNRNIQASQRTQRLIITLIANQYFIDLHKSLIFFLFCHSSQSFMDAINCEPVHQCCLPQLIQFSKGTYMFGTGTSVYHTR